MFIGKHLCPITRSRRSQSTSSRNIRVNYLPECPAPQECIPPRPAAPWPQSKVSRDARAFTCGRAFAALPAHNEHDRQIDYVIAHECDLFFAKAASARSCPECLTCSERPDMGSRFSGRAPARPPSPIRLVTIPSSGRPGGPVDGCAVAGVEAFGLNHVLADDANPGASACFARPPCCAARKLEQEEPDGAVGKHPSTSNSTL